MERIIRIILILTAIVFGVIIIFSVFWPFALNFINEKLTVGDALMHLANAISINRDHPFPIMAWKSEWAGYPLIEGYPWLHYYIFQPILSAAKSPGLAMDYYMTISLLIYYIAAFLLLFYVSKNVFLALFFSLVLIYGADSQMPLSVNAFMTFTATMFLLPLILTILIFAREKNSTKLFLIASFFFAVAFYAHGSLTGIVILPIIFPFLILNVAGKISKESIVNTIRFFLVFALISATQIYQFVDYNRQGYLRGVKPFPLDIIPERFSNLMTWENPVLLPLLIIFTPLFIFAAKKSFSKLKPYLLSLLFIIFIFTLMLFNITSMNLVLLAERVLWGLSLSFLLLFSKAVVELTGSSIKKQIAVYVFGFALAAIYLFFTLIVKPAHLVPDTLRAYDQYYFKSDGSEDITPDLSKYSSKYDLVYAYSPLPWNGGFDNYRTDGISYNIYSNWNIWSSNTRYKGRFPAAKGFPLDWSGLVAAAETGNLGEAGSTDNSQWAINQSIFFFDWYAIRHFEISENDLELADFLRKKPYIASTDKRPNFLNIGYNLVYHNIDSRYVGPIYAPTNVKTMAVVSPETQYDNFIRTLSYSEFTSKRLIPIYLGSNVNAINKDNLKYFDSVFLYGYKKPLFGSNIWNILNDYVRNGGKLIVETGQKVSETGKVNLPEVFPVKTTQMTIISQPWSLEAERNNLTKGINKADFNPIKTKYLPYSISEAEPESLKDWAKPVLIKDGNVVMAFGRFGKGSVVWSGLNLPFHAIDNRNTSETAIFANILNWFFPEIEAPLSDFKINRPNPGKITVSAAKGKGVLLKENYNSGWRATLNGKGAMIYKAGLFEMYIPLDSNRGEYVIELNYLGAPIHWLLFFVSFASLIVIFMYLFFNKNLLLWIGKFIKFDKKAEEENY